MTQEYLSELHQCFMLAVEFNFFEETVGDYAKEIIEQLQNKEFIKFSERDVRILKDSHSFSEETQTLLRKVIELI